MWGKLGSELEEADVDMNDPNYDSDSLDNGDVELKTIIPEMSDEDIKVREYTLIVFHPYTYKYFMYYKI